MKADMYTKLILTIIAGCLVWICMRDVPFITRAHAQPAVTQVQIVGTLSPLPVVPYSGPLSSSGPVANQTPFAVYTVVGPAH